MRKGLIASGTTTMSKRYRLQDDARLAALVTILARRPNSEPRLSYRTQAVGIVVSVMQWTAYNAPAGDLSVFAPQVLAAAIEWQDDADELIDHLQESGFLEPYPRTPAVRSVVMAN